MTFPCGTQTVDASWSKGAEDIVPWPSAKVFVLASDRRQGWFGPFFQGQNGLSTWEAATSPGFLWRLDVETRTPVRLEIVGYEQPDFHPHGLKLVEDEVHPETAAKIYVLTHGRDGSAIAEFSLSLDNNQAVFTGRHKLNGIYFANALAVDHIGTSRGGGASETQFFVTGTRTMDISALISGILFGTNAQSVLHCSNGVDVGSGRNKGSERGEMSSVSDEYECHAVSANGEELMIANGLDNHGTRVFVNDWGRRQLHVLDRVEKQGQGGAVELQKVESFDFDGWLPDNVNIDAATGDLYVVVHSPKILMSGFETLEDRSYDAVPWVIHRILPSPPPAAAPAGSDSGSGSGSGRKRKHEATTTVASSAGILASFGDKGVTAATGAAFVADTIAVGQVAHDGVMVCSL